MNGLSLDQNSRWNVNLVTLLSELKLRGPVAILIDEYDNPFHKALDWSEELQIITQDVFRDFYTTLKSLENHYNFMFITGITKIDKTSLFSGMNMLEDISLEPQFASLCGVTHDELESYFKAHIEKMAVCTNNSTEDVLKCLQLMYNGFRFSHKNSLKVYNPFSLLHAFNSNEISNFWFESGTPTLLVNLIKQKDYDLSL